MNHAYVAFQRGSEVKLQKAQITLNDCLACSGCVTSAESVLISEQSQEEFFKVLSQNAAVEASAFLVLLLWPEDTESFINNFLCIAIPGEGRS